MSVDVSTPTFAVLAVLVCMAVEAGAGRVLAWKRYELSDTLASLTLGAGGLLMGIVSRAIAIPISYWLYEYRLFDLDDVWPVWVLLVVAEDLCFYSFHRSCHRVRMLWAAHAPHHSSHRFNLSTGVRLSWTTPILGIPFWWPLPLLGFHPLWIVAAHSVSLGYQFLLHTEAVGRLGPIEWVFNTPSHHRVHHACDAMYVDKNFGGVLIIWDRLFGTFQAERSRPTYGLVHPPASDDPLTLALGEWRNVLRDAFDPEAAPLGRWGAIFGPPEATPRPVTVVSDAGGIPSPPPWSRIKHATRPTAPGRASTGRSPDSCSPGTATGRPIARFRWTVPPRSGETRPSPRCTSTILACREHTVGCGATVTAGGSSTSGVATAPSSTGSLAARSRRPVGSCASVSTCSC